MAAHPGDGGDEGRATFGVGLLQVPRPAAEQELPPLPTHPSISSSQQDQPGDRSRAPSIDIRGLPIRDSRDLRGDSEDTVAVSHNTAWRVRPSGCMSPRRAPRMIDRDSHFKQSGGRVNIRRKDDQQHAVRRLRDLFHTLVNMNTGKLFVFASAFVVGSWLLFAVFFRLVSYQCGLKANSFLKAVYLAIETVETIGYGVPDSYFEGCYSGVFVLGAAALWATFVNALSIAVIYTRVSRPQRRASSVCFSEKAIISEIRGQIYLMVQVCDVRKHQLVEAHVRLYCIQHAPTSSGVVFQTRAMRLQHPDDELGGMLLMSLPQVVVHRVDPWSPLWPQTDGLERGTPANSFAFPDILQRAADAENGNRDGGPASSRPPAPELAQVSNRVRRGQLEVLCIVEGIDPSTSMTLQARHSYTCDDLVFNAAFQRCVSRGADGTCEIDFNAFHELVEQSQDEGMLVQSMA